jgi:hypothetical protein
MITSKQIIKISEEWYKTLKNPRRGEDVPVYENPSSSDITKLISASKNRNIEVRFLADANKKTVYAWNANLAIHNDIRLQMGYPKTSSHTDLKDVPYLFEGHSSISGGRLVGTDEGSLETLDTISQNLSFYNSLTQADYIRGNTGQLQTYIDVLKGFSRCDWSFINKYVSNIVPELDKIKSKFITWYKNHDFVR